MLGPHEALTNSVIDQGDQGIEIAIHIEQANRFLVETKLRPGDDFEQLV
jgi:hypothetical protein